MRSEPPDHAFRILVPASGGSSGIAPGAQTPLTDITTRHPLFAGNCPESPRRARADLEPVEARRHRLPERLRLRALGLLHQEVVELERVAGRSYSSLTPGPGQFPPGAFRTPRRPRMWCECPRTRNPRSARSAAHGGRAICGPGPPVAASASARPVSGTQMRYRALRPRSPGSWVRDRPFRPARRTCGVEPRSFEADGPQAAPALTPRKASPCHSGNGAPRTSSRCRRYRSEACCGALRRPATRRRSLLPPDQRTTASPAHSGSAGGSGPAAERSAEAAAVPAACRRRQARCSWGTSEAQRRRNARSRPCSGLGPRDRRAGLGASRCAAPSACTT